MKKDDKKEYALKLVEKLDQTGSIVDEKLRDIIASELAEVDAIYFSWGLIEKKLLLPDWQFLSNMSPINFTLNGHEYASVEHYFQSEPLRPYIHQSDEILQAFNEVLSAPDGFAAKRANKKHSDLIIKLWGDTQPSFSSIKTDVMEKGVRAKVECHPAIKKLLKFTQGKQIIEDGGGHRDVNAPEPGKPYWNMKIWRGQWYGENALGKIWMKIRDEIVAKEN
eukprot:TRINITY_DN6797_c0_g1_i1.p1 TRINITY_DN6797_c0_g1~~TRINITY_DN6797_c0_g1_i1.p1  ORF type:complete len:257 (+),score=61.32 TRINITY_DN6797_c0_g1_i1:108-773(+)